MSDEHPLMEKVIVAEQNCMLQFHKKLRLYTELVRETVH